MKIPVTFDDYEMKLLLKVRKDLMAAAKASGAKMPSFKEVIRASVRMGIHAVYGEDYLAEDLLAKDQFPELVNGIDTCQFKD